MMKNGYAKYDSSMHGRVISVDHLSTTQPAVRAAIERPIAPARARGSDRETTGTEPQRNPTQSRRQRTNGWLADAAVRSAARARSACSAWLAYRQRQRGATRRASHAAPSAAPSHPSARRRALTRAGRGRADRGACPSEVITTKSVYIAVAQSAKRSPHCAARTHARTSTAPLRTVLHYSVGRRCAERCARTHACTACTAGMHARIHARAHARTRAGRPKHACKRNTRTRTQHALALARTRAHAHARTHARKGDRAGDDAALTGSEPGWVFLSGPSK